MDIQTNSKVNVSYANPNPQNVYSNSGITQNTYEDITSYINKNEVFRISGNMQYLKITLDDSTIQTYNSGVYDTPTIVICGNRFDFIQKYSGGWGLSTKIHNWIKVEIMRSSSALSYSILKY